MKFSMLLTTDLRLLAYFVTFMKRTKNAKLFESRGPPVARTVSPACPPMLCVHRGRQWWLWEPVPPLVVFAHALLNRVRGLLLHI